MQTLITVMVARLVRGSSNVVLQAPQYVWLWTISIWFQATIPVHSQGVHLQQLTGKNVNFASMTWNDKITQNNRVNNVFNEILLEYRSNVLLLKIVLTLKCELSPNLSNAGHSRIKLYCYKVKSVKKLYCHPTNNTLHGIHRLNSK